MPLVARRLYAAGLSAPSMLFWRYVWRCWRSARPRRDRPRSARAWREGAWRIALVGATLGAAQTLCFWESIKTLETSIAVLLFYTYPAVTLALDRLVFKQPIRRSRCFASRHPARGGADHRAGPARRHDRPARPGLGAAGAAGLRVLSRDQRAAAAALSAADRRRPVCSRHGGNLRADRGAGSASTCRRAGRLGCLLLFVALGPGALTMTLFSYSVPRLGASSFAILANTEFVTVVRSASWCSARR